MSTERSSASSAEGKGVLSGFTTWMENLSEQAYAYLLLLPAFALLGLIAFWPLFETFRISLYEDVPASSEPGDFVGLDNYIDILTASNPYLPREVIDLTFSSTFPYIGLGSSFFRQALFVTLAFAILSVIFETLIGFGQAYIMAKEYRGRRWVRVAIILPWAIPVVIQGMIFYLIFQETVGFATGPLQTIGVFGSGNPLASSRDSFIIVLVADVWKTAAFMALLILAGLQSIDRSLYDVAEVSGASRWQRFTMITFPLLLPALLVAMLFRTLDAMRVYGVIDTASSCSLVPSFTCLVVDTMFGASRNPAAASAVAFITALVICIVVLIFINQLRDSQGV